MHLQETETKDAENQQLLGPGKAKSVQDWEW